MNGFELYNELKKLDPIIKVCFITGYEVTIERCKEYFLNLIKDVTIKFQFKNKINLVNENLLSGVTSVNTKSSTIDMNNVHGSRDGVFIDEQSDDNTVSTNNVLDNDIDISNANGLPININSNQYAENNCGVNNPSGLCIGR
jgi:hypothetical protein